MKKIILFFIPILIIIAGYALFQQTDKVLDMCKGEVIKEKCKDKLKPYKYDASKITAITFKEKSQLKEMEIPLYFGEKYRFIFNTEGLHQNIVIEIYNKKFDVKKRELLYTTKNFPETQREFIWEPDKSRTMYIDYIIPAVAPSDTVKKGCAVFVLGFKI